MVLQLPLLLANSRFHVHLQSCISEARPIYNYIIHSKFSAHNWVLRKSRNLARVPLLASPFIRFRTQHMPNEKCRHRSRTSKTVDPSLITLRRSQRLIIIDEDLGKHQEYPE